MQTPELDAFRAECAAVDQTLADVPTDAWTRTALGSWTLAELVAHMVRGVSRLTAYVDLPVDADHPDVDRVGYWHGVQDVAADVAARAVDAARKVDAETLPALFVEAWQDDADLAAALPADQLVMTTRGAMRADEFLATRVLEVTVHHLDLRTALDLPANPTAEAGRVTMELLEALLGAPHPRNLGRLRFLLTATGRMPSDDDRFPLLA